jgi:hypothetical protein
MHHIQNRIRKGLEIMIRKWVVFISLAVLTVPAAAAAAGEAQDGSAPIFNGKDLTGWDGDPRFWSVKDGAIRGQTTKENPAPHNTFLIWRGGELTDFELRLSFRITSGNSGVQVRSKDRGNWRVTGYQVEVTPARGAMGLFYDEGGRGALARAGQKVVIDAQGGKEVVGSLGEASEIQKVYKEKEWNELTAIGLGNGLTQKINGVVFSEVADEHQAGRALSGILALQIHSGPPMLVEFKDIRLKKIPKDQAVALFNGKDLTDWKIVQEADFEWHGKVYVKDGKIMLEQGGPFTGIAWTKEFPRTNYEVSLEAMRVAGYDFFCGMTFPVGDSWCTLIVGGWGGMVVGLSNIDDMNASENETTRGMCLEDKRWYPIRVQVTDTRIEVWIDKEKVISIVREGHRFGVWEEQCPIKPFGVATWNTGGALRNIALRRLDK